MQIKFATRNPKTERHANYFCYRHVGVFPYKGLDNADGLGGNDQNNADQQPRSWRGRVSGGMEKAYALATLAFAFRPRWGASDTGACGAAAGAPVPSGVASRAAIRRT